MAARNKENVTYLHIGENGLDMRKPYEFIDVNLLIAQLVKGTTDCCKY
jgi:hypothetical protein